MSTIYRFLSEDDTSAFCHKVSDALAKGWSLHGNPTYSFDAARGVMRCGQAVIKEIATPYTADMKLGEQ
ncbi:MAG: DUF1737 domain-containing protein [Rhodobacteraceae bacterium]|nr:DUF1737 domain-containing protein [Paracoccaceae bacterium]